jgi:predicted small lipoprotein YifL
VATVTGVLVAALGLAGCGRKGPLDPPPAAAISQPGQPGQPAARFDAQGNPVAPPAQGKEPFILDWLVD